MADRYLVDCPAKLNLILRVGAKDRRGYHPLETMFQAVGLFDTLEVTVGGSGLEIDGMDLPAQNTVTRAWRLMQEVATLPPVGLRLTKRIPSEAGLGGGSSDAAGVLRVFRKLLPPSVPDRDFQSVASSVGADVAFFIVGGRAWATGYGDQLTPQPDETTQWIVLVKPQIGCSTPAMYAKLDAAREASAALPLLREGWGENDFNAVAPPECTSLIESLLESGCASASLSGSGSSVFGLVPSQGVAEAIAARFEQAWAVPTLTREQSLVIRKVE